MLFQFKMRFNEISSRLTRITENEPLSLLSIAIAVLLDLFVLVNLFTGLNEQTKQLTSPDEYIPYVCREILIDKNWVEENRIQELSHLILHEQRSYWEIIPDKTDKHPVCRDIYMTIKEIKSNRSLFAYFDERDKLVKRYNSYDYYQRQINPEVDKILSDIKGIDEKINAFTVIKDFWTTISNKDELSETLTKDLRRINITFSVRQLTFNILFMFPVIILLYIWNSVSIQKNRYLQIFISSHLLIVSFIPVFFEVCRAVFDIIPRKLFRQVIEFLESWNLIAIWYYIIMIAAVIISLFLIYLVQKKIFTKERLMRKRLEKKKCIDCGRPLPYQLNFCPFCGSSQSLICPSCRQETLQGASFCIKCGKELR